MKVANHKVAEVGGGVAAMREALARRIDKLAVAEGDTATAGIAGLAAVSPVDDDGVRFGCV